jgi:hypothetical protein
MANIQIGKYKRPGIFIEEFDQSIISSPVVEGITNLIMGVSKKGPVNTPIRLTTLADLESVFGQLDRGLERKSSFFHRTVSKMLEIAPVFAMNLLLTDDSLDVIEYKSISASAGSNNDIKREGPYRRFFDTTGFWKRDTESFINLTKNNLGYSERAFNLTNLSDRPITVFVVKSELVGFDRTLLEWYGSVDRMPTYVNPQDFASDYLVDVVVVGGDWSNYQELSVDPRWSAYFNASGLRKDQIRNFANDRNISLLSYYEGLSLIPYFRDLNGRNIFIETTINRDTDRTGLFCAFNNDLVEEDFYNGRLDLLGNTIVGINETNINFLSYKELIAEKIQLTSTPLDLPRNVTALLGNFGYINQPDHAFGSVPMESGIVDNGNNRTAWFGEGSVYNVTGGSTSLTSTASTISVDYVVGQNAFTVIGNNKIDITQGTVTLNINSSDYPSSQSNQSYIAVVVLGDDGEIVMNTTTIPSTRPAVSPSDIVLGYVDFDVVYPGDFANVQFTDVTIDSNGFVDLQFGTDYDITDLGSGRIKIEFLNTATQQLVTNYEQYRRFKIFNRLVNLIDSTAKRRMTMNLGPSNNYDKKSLESVNITNIVTSTVQNKSFVLETGLTYNDLEDAIEDGYLVLYTVDNEFILGENSLLTKDQVADSSEGVVARYSTFYSRYFDGIINTRDFFFSNRLYVDSSGIENTILGNTVNITLIDGEDGAGLTSPYAGFDFIVFESTVNFAQEVDFQTFEQIQIPASINNPGSFTILGNNINNLNPNQVANALGFAGSNFYAYQVNEEVEFEQLFNVDMIYDFVNRNYLKMFLDNDGLLSVRFKDQLLEAQLTINTKANNTIFVQSRTSNLKQSLEIEVPSNYVQVPNKVLVDAARYTEVRVGDFLEAYVDEESLEFGQVPRKLTRILSKRQYTQDTSLTEITCDSRIKTYNFSGDLQTFRYVSIDNYATTYKAITLKGFRIRQNSLPDGTEERQNRILNLVAKGTPLFKAITNKEAIDFRYLIDSFGLGLTERSKQQLVDICGDRLDTFGFINMPSLRQFKNSSSPSFVDSEGTLQLEFVAQGGDPESNPAFLYSFGDGAGTTCVGYFTPYITVNDNGRPLDMPPASHVATTYMRKHISNITSITPWTIAAGITNGRITNITGIEMDFTPEDIEFLNQAQINPIVFKRNRGFIIETENTGQTLVRSALSLIHVREVLIELERELSRMLLDYQWKFNTPDVRAEIKLRADVICETYVSKNGLFNYFNKMDDENNTPEIIDNQIGVLDTYVEPIKGMGIIVNNITILRTGAISAGGFINP